jgi:hypothetical protein
MACNRALGYGMAFNKALGRGNMLMGDPGALAPDTSAVKEA